MQQQLPILGANKNWRVWGEETSPGHFCGVPAFGKQNDFPARRTTHRKQLVGCWGQSSASKALRCRSQVSKSQWAVQLGPSPSCCYAHSREKYAALWPVASSESPNRLTGTKGCLQKGSG